MGPIPSSSNLASSPPPNVAPGTWGEYELPFDDDHDHGNDDDFDSSSQTKHINDEDDWVGQGGLWAGDDGVLAESV